MFYDIEHIHHHRGTPRERRPTGQSGRKERRRVVPPVSSEARTTRDGMQVAWISREPGPKAMKAGGINEYGSLPLG